MHHTFENNMITYRDYEEFHKSLDDLVKSKTSETSIKNFVDGFFKERNLSIDATDCNGRTVLVQLVYDGRLKHADLLLKCGANLHQRDTRGNTLVHHAMNGVCSKDLGASANFAPLQFVLDRGLSLNARNTKGETPVFALWWNLINPNKSFLLDTKMKLSSKRILEVLPWVSERTDVFAKDNTGRSCFACTPADMWLSEFSEYQHLERALQDYKAFDQAQTLRDALDQQSLNAAPPKKQKI